VPARSTSALRRLALALVAAPLLLTVLAGCGDDDGGGDDQAGAGLDSLTVEGEPGSSPEVTFDGQVSVSEPETKTLVEGEGDEVEKGDQVLTHLWIGNGYTQEEALNTYDDKKPELLTVDDQILEVFRDAVEGHTIGSRVLVAAPAEDAFGEAGNPNLGIANTDTVILIVDLVSGVADGPEGTEKDAPDWAPTIVEKDGVPTGFDFKGTPKPDDQLRSATLVQGEGPKVEKGQTIVVDYLGQVYDGKAPFDESYTKEPASFPIGVGSVVKGWDKALVGKPVGSRVVLAIPPDLGYGEDGNKDAGIKGTDTLYFVVDILAAG
jgi:peptidylprolyl isomerase